ncbi:MAG: NAD-dependent epimerase/dehydratase family protein [Candidatus Cloacimonetes bacterium]|nr:NAD-dependent epimerase/dehydratase family protein [Candidatus Cloacimonadota bacterium]
MRVLVTGGLGFIGRNLVQKLLKLGHSVIVLDDLSTGFLQNQIPGSQLLTSDISCEEFWRDLPPVDCVFHLAAMVSVPQSFLQPIRCQDVNVNGTIRLLSYCQRHGVNRLIMASSAAVYGDSPDQSEQSVPRPKSPYGLTKLAGEYLLQIAQEQFGLSWVAFRKFNVFGPGQSVASAYASVIPRFIVQALNNQPLEIHGDGEQTRDFIFVDQVTDYYIQAMHNSFVGVCNMGNGKTMSVNDLVHILKKRFPQMPPPRFSPPRNGDIKNSQAVIHTLLSNFQPVPFDFEDALDQTIFYYRKESGEKNPHWLQ